MELRERIEQFLNEAYSSDDIEEASEEISDVIMSTGWPTISAYEKYRPGKKNAYINVVKLYTELVNLKGNEDIDYLETLSTQCDSELESLVDDFEDSKLFGLGLKESIAADFWNQVDDTAETGPEHWKDELSDEEFQEKVTVISKKAESLLKKL
jgi:hypothetical protein